MHLYGTYFLQVPYIIIIIFNKMIDLHFYIKRLRNFMSWY